MASGAPLTLTLTLTLTLILILTRQVDQGSCLDILNDNSAAPSGCYIIRYATKREKKSQPFFSFVSFLFVVIVLIHFH